jgi:hypothetical protein
LISNELARRGHPTVEHFVKPNLANGSIVVGIGGQSRVLSYEERQRILAGETLLEDALGAMLMVMADAADGN